MRRSSVIWPPQSSHGCAGSAVENRLQRTSPHSVQLTACSRMARMASIDRPYPGELGAETQRLRTHMYATREVWCKTNRVPGVGLEPTSPHGQPFLRGPTLPVCLPGLSAGSYGYPGWEQ